MSATENLLRALTTALDSLVLAEQDQQNQTGYRSRYPRQNKGQYCSMVRVALESAEAELGDSECVRDAWRVFDSYKT